MDYYTMGLIIISFAWLLQAYHFFKGDKKTNIMFLLLYAVGTLMLITEEITALTLNHIILIVPITVALMAYLKK